MSEKCELGQLGMITHTMFDVLGMDHSNYIEVLMNPNY